ncbi:MAG: 2OG-Fe(II) oxygenase [Magnetococcales bacterium]|nr:2OG-Fe(II) oxygenase [Magnetococcales bacterium]
MIDTSVRKTWQIHADHVHIGGQRWQETLKTIVRRSAEGLGVGENIKAELYKLLIYEEGGFFLSHRDTEKVDGMFATLVVVMPSVYSGGELVIRHQERQVRLDLKCDEPSEVAFAAFYADCRHEVLPVTSGCRLVLVYNLLQLGDNHRAKPPDYHNEEGKIATLLRQWAQDRSEFGRNSPEKLVYPLDHAYTEAGISFSSLKGEDAARASALVAAARQADCEIHLALLSIAESGTAEYASDYVRHRGQYVAELEVGEICERNLSLSNWQHPDGGGFDFGEFPFFDGELSPPDIFEDSDPDELEFEEATGNEGPSFERLYRSAALVLWPKDQTLVVLCQGGLSVTLPYLNGLVDQWCENRQDLRSPLWLQAHTLAKHMIRGWPRNPHHSWMRQEKTPRESWMLTLLKRLGDTEHIETFLSELSVQGVYGKEDNQAIVEALKLLSAPEATGLVERIVFGNIKERLHACGDLLARAVEIFRGDQSDSLRPAANVLLASLPADSDQSSTSAFWRQSKSIEPDFIVDLLNALGSLDGSLANQAVGILLANPVTFHLDKVLIPATLNLCNQSGIHDLTSFKRLWGACLDHLRTRSVEPLEPPNNWSRANFLTCQCVPCMELARFLANPLEKVWVYKAAEAKRSHVSSVIQGSECDVDWKIDRNTRPYALICTKNQVSYEKRVRQRKHDFENLAKLKNCSWQ